MSQISHRLLGLSMSHPEAQQTELQFSFRRHRDADFLSGLLRASQPHIGTELRQETVRHSPSDKTEMCNLQRPHSAAAEKVVDENCSREDNHHFPWAVPPVNASLRARSN